MDTKMNCSLCRWKALEVRWERQEGTKQATASSTSLWTIQGPGAHCEWLS